MTARATPLFAGNWKMHKGPRDAGRFVARFSELHAPRSDRRVAFFPAAVSLPAFLAAAAGRPDLEAGVQDVHEEAEGAHTGAISASMAAEAGAKWSLSGHSERRREFGDDDALVAAKTRRILEASLKPIVCIGETLEEREAGRLEEVLERQVRTVLAGLAGDAAARLTWAYEPVWAIGTGRTASAEDASAAHGIARDAIAAGAGDATAESATLLYGGSVKPASIAELMAAPGVDGVLVGGASLDPEAFAAICASPLPAR
ncbi:MAG: triose-phosphate isomerase [Gemmatimonadota bacterium]